VHILKSKKAKFDPSKFEDRYDSALKRLIAAKQHGRKPPSTPAPGPSNVINLMDALRRSVQGKGEQASSGHARPKAERKRSAPKPAPAKRRKLKRAS
jgi:DNA end-binding protein Ku